MPLVRTGDATATPYQPLRYVILHHRHTHGVSIRCLSHLQQHPGTVLLLKVEPVAIFALFSV